MRLNSSFKDSLQFSVLAIVCDHFVFLWTLGISLLGSHDCILVMCCAM